MKPMWQEIEEAVPELKTEYYDADMDSGKLEEFGVETVPIFIFFDNEGKEFLRLKGAQNKEDLKKIVMENIDK